MREVRVQLDPASVARLEEARHRMTQLRRRTIVHAQVAFAAERDERVAHRHVDGLRNTRAKPVAFGRRGPGCRDRRRGQRADPEGRRQRRVLPVTVARASAPGSPCASRHRCAKASSGVMAEWAVRKTTSSLGSAAGASNPDCMNPHITHGRTPCVPAETADLTSSSAQETCRYPRYRREPRVNRDLQRSLPDRATGHRYHHVDRVPLPARCRADAKRSRASVERSLERDVPEPDSQITQIAA